MSSKQIAKASGRSLPISFKDSVNVCSAIRGMLVEKALRYLEDVIKLKRPIPYKRYRRDMAHRKGIGPGRFPRKECKYIKEVLKNAIANAKAKGMDSSKLYISKIIANQAVSKEKVKRGFSKGTHIYIEVAEKEIVEEKSKKKKVEKEEKVEKVEEKVEEKKEEAKEVKEEKKEEEEKESKEEEKVEERK